MASSSARHKYSMDHVNRMDFYEFQDKFGNVMENSRFCAASVWSFRPFHDVRHLHEAFCHFVDQLPTTGKQGLLRGFPDLAVRLSAIKDLTPESASEQQLAGLLDVTEADRRRLAYLNSYYKGKFGFPFVICARLNNVRTILAALESRLENRNSVQSKPDSELEVAIDQAKEVCRLRLLDLVDNDEQDRVQTGSNL